MPMKGDRKRKKKFYYIRAAKGAKLNNDRVLSPGMKGFLCTCNDREKECVREGYSLLNEYADKLYGPELEAPVLSEDDDLEAALAKELAGYKKLQEQDRRFQRVKCGANNCIFIKTKLEDPLELLHHILTDINKSNTQKTRYLLRVLPVHATCKARLNDIKTSIEPLLNQYFQKDSPKDYDILIKIRNNNSFSRDDVISLLADRIDLQNPLNRRRSKTAQVVLYINVIRTVCCISVLIDFYKLRKYNVLECSKTSNDKSELSENNQLTELSEREDSPSDVKVGEACQEQGNCETIPVDTEAPDVGVPVNSSDEPKGDMT